MSSASPKQALFAQFAAVAKAIGHPHRLGLLEQLAQGERSVEVLADRTGLSIANASQHLQQLRRSGLIVARREGKHVLYRLGDHDAVLGMLAAVQRLAERNLAEVQQVLAGYFRERDGLEPVSRAELVARLRRGEVVLLDVRPEDEYALGHLPGALNVPLGRLEEQLAQLPKDREIVAYCRGPYCVLAVGAVRLLRGRGFRARRLEEGVPDWLALGLEVATGPPAAGG